MYTSFFSISLADKTKCRYPVFICVLCAVFSRAFTEYFIILLLCVLFFFSNWPTTLLVPDAQNCSSLFLYIAKRSSPYIQLSSVSGVIAVLLTVLPGCRSHPCESFCNWEFVLLNLAHLFSHTPHSPHNHQYVLCIWVCFCFVWC